MELALASGLQIRPSTSQSHAAAGALLSARQRSRCCSELSERQSHAAAGALLSAGRSSRCCAELSERQSHAWSGGRRRVFLVDVNPLCYSGSRPSLQSFGYWMSLLLRRVSLEDPVIAVFDGENGSEKRRRLLPSYKAQRWEARREYSKGFVGRWRAVLEECLGACGIRSMGVAGQEADDVIATLAEQVSGSCSVVIASPDKDFRQLLSERVSLAVPLGDVGRWSFCTARSYAGQHGLGPASEVSLRCLLGDAADGVPGIHTLAPGFGRKTAVRLLQRHGTLHNLLAAAAVRTVGKPYAQHALLAHAHFLRTNYQVLSLSRHLPGVSLPPDWLAPRDSRHDQQVFDHFFHTLHQHHFY